jgi:hypothetical protein
MLPRLGAYPDDGAHFLTAAQLPMRKIGGMFFEYYTPEHPARLVPSTTGAVAISRFEFLAHLAALGESALYRVDNVVIAMRGFAGPRGWAFEHGPEDAAGQGTVRLATRSERDAEGTQLASRIERGSFVAEACCLRERTLIALDATTPRGVSETR